MTRKHLKIVKFLKKHKVSGFASRVEISKKLRKCGFRYIGSGCYKMVFGHVKFPEWVVKIHKHDKKERDCQNYTKLPKKLRKHYARPVFVEDRLLVQKKCDTKRGQGEVAFNKLKRLFRNSDIMWYDIHDSNTGMINGKPFFFDFLHERL